MNPGASLWQNRTFVLLFGAQVVSLVGSGATTIGLALFAYRLAGAASATLVVGTALTLRIVAFLLFSQPAGVLADRTNRKRILIAADVLRAGLLGLLPFASTIWHVYVMIFLINAVTAFFSPTYQAIIPAVVGEFHLVRALAVSRVAQDLETIASPAIAVALVSVLGARWVFWFDAGTYAASAALVLCATIPRVYERGPALSLGSLWGEVSYGTRAILRQRVLRQTLVLSFVEALAGAVAIVATVTYVRDLLQLGDTEVAVAMAAVGVGSTLAALGLGKLTGRYERTHAGAAALHGSRHVWTRRALLLGGTCLGVVLLPLWFGPPFAVLVTLWAFNGVGQSLISIGSSTLLAEHTFPAERGRVYAAYFALTHACWLVTYPLIGIAGARLGVTVTMAAAGVACLFLTAVAALLRGRTGDHVHSPSSPSSAGSNT